MALEEKIKLLSEGLARTVDRRKFLKKSGTTIFATLAAVAAGHSLVTKASADTGDTPNPPWPPQCSPPGPYCNITGTPDLSGCHGGSCFQHLVSGVVLQCHVIYNWYQAGCWTTPVTGGYWTCCDCGCGNPQQAMCGCAQFSTSPSPRPDRIVSGNKRIF